MKDRFLTDAREQRQITDKSSPTTILVFIVTIVLRDFALFWGLHYFHVMVLWVSKSQGKKLSEATQQIGIEIYLCRVFKRCCCCVSFELD